MASDAVANEEPASPAEPSQDSVSETTTPASPADSEPSAVDNHETDVTTRIPRQNAIPSRIPLDDAIPVHEPASQEVAGNETAEIPATAPIASPLPVRRRRTIAQGSGSYGFQQQIPSYRRSASQYANGTHEDGEFSPHSKVPYVQGQGFPSQQDVDAADAIPVPEFLRKKGVTAPMMVGGIAGVAVLGAIVFAVAMANPFRDTSKVVLDGNGNAAVISQETPQTQSESAATEAPATTEAAPALAAKAALADYSWDELSQISQLIAAADSSDKAVAIAVEYHLCAADGTIDPAMTKEIALSDGTVAQMQIAGFYHDVRSDTKGRAGITFVSANTVATHAVNDSGSSEGGWRDSELRAWMNGELLAELPKDVSSLVVPVEKETNSVGETTSTSSVVATSDSLWVPSYCELSGQQDTGDDTDAVYNAEGDQYALFAQQGVKWNEENALLVKDVDGEPGEWWLRSPDPNTQYWMNVGEDGKMYYAHGAQHDEYGIVMGFCL